MQFSGEVGIGYNLLEACTHKIGAHIAIVDIASVIERSMVAVLTQLLGNRGQRGALTRHIHHTHRRLCRQCTMDRHQGTVCTETIGIELGEAEALLLQLQETRSNTLDMHDAIREAL